MNETDKTKKDEDWAILPFNEAEDDDRWTKLSAEMNELEKKVIRHEAVHGTILMEEDFSALPAEEKAQSDSDRNETIDDEPF